MNMALKVKPRAINPDRFKQETSLGRGSELEVLSGQKAIEWRLSEDGNTFTQMCDYIIKHVPEKEGALLKNHFFEELGDADGDFVRKMQLLQPMTQKKPNEPSTIAHPYILDQLSYMRTYCEKHLIPELFETKDEQVDFLKNIEDMVLRDLEKLQCKPEAGRSR